MFQKPYGNTTISRTAHLAIQSDINQYIKPTLGVVAAQIQEARALLIVALSRYQSTSYECGAQSKQIYPAYLSERQSALSDLIGNIQNDEGTLSMWHLLSDGQKITRDNIMNIISSLNQILLLKKNHPPLKKTLQESIKNAITLLFEGLRKGGHFPASADHENVQMITELSKQIDAEKLHHILCQHPNLIKNLHLNPNHRRQLQEVPGLLQTIDQLYHKLFPTKDFLAACTLASLYQKQAFYAPSLAPALLPPGRGQPAEQKPETPDHNPGKKPTNLRL
jgi:hypothetical protein